MCACIHIVCISIVNIMLCPWPFANYCNSTARRICCCCCCCCCVTSTKIHGFVKTDTIRSTQTGTSNCTRIKVQCVCFFLLFYLAGSLLFIALGVRAYSICVRKWIWHIWKCIRSWLWAISNDRLANMSEADVRFNAVHCIWNVDVLVY